MARTMGGAMVLMAFLKPMVERSPVDPLPSCLPLQFLQHRLGVNQVVVEDRTRHRQQFDDERVAEGVSHGRSEFAGRDNVLPSQDRQLLGDDRLLEIQLLLQFLDTALACAEHLENTDANGMGQGAKEVSLE